MIPPVPGPPQRRPSREQVAKRRAAALLVLVIAAGIVLAVVFLAVRGRGHAAAPVTTVAPPPPPLRIVFPEGFTRKDMARRIAAVDVIARRKRHVRPRLSAAAYLRVTARLPVPRGFGRPRSPEGFLFPATYDFLPATTSRQLALQQLKAFRRNWAKLDLGYARAKHLTPYDVLIIASMVEKEALAPDERPLVAAVIYNRLHAHMTLGIDATLRYGLDIPPTKSIRQSQLQSDSPYNTRKVAGLPPTPIANPGLASMQAAAHPARVKYLYFVRKPDKQHHFFTASFRDFVNYERKHGYIR
ncbi:MAG TPA: endolytic transglycosylase MltG [Gaiellaceae bacterium]|jgi:UPF0755 protein